MRRLIGRTSLCYKKGAASSMDFFLRFPSPLLTEAYSNSTKSKWSSWNFMLKCTIFFLGLSSLTNLTFYLQAEKPLITKYYEVQTFYAASLTLFSIVLFFVSKYIFKFCKAHSFLATIIAILNMIVSYELHFVYSKDLNQEDQHTSNLSIIYDKLFPTMLLFAPHHSWIYRSILVAVMTVYNMLRAAPVKLLACNAVYVFFAFFMLVYLFYKVEKENKMKFISQHTQQTNDKLMKDLLNSCPEGFLILDRDNKPVYVNLAMKAVLGTEPTEEAIMKKISDFKFEMIIPEVQRHCENLLHDRSYSNNSPLFKGVSAPESPEKSPTNLLAEHPRVSFDKTSSPLMRPRPRNLKLGLPVPSLYLDDLKFKRKMSKKFSFKENSEDLKIQKDNSLFLECPSPKLPQLSRSKSYFNISQGENQFKLRIEGEKFKGYVTNPVKNNFYYMFNLYEETDLMTWRKSDNGMDEPDHMAYEVKYREVQLENESYKFLIMSDISLREKMVNLEESSKYKNLMFASISHEFRTPVNGIQTLLEAAANELKTEKIVDTHIKPALNSAQMLTFLINDLLDYSKILVDKLILSLDMFSVKSCMEEVKSLMAAQAEIKDLKLEITVRKDAPAYVKSDKTRIQQILVNLLSNSLKFTKQGSVEVVVEGIIYTTHCLKISVRDTGMGLNPADIERLNLTMNTMNIGHVGQKVSTSSSGIGMGLMITQSLALALGPSEEAAPGVAGLSIDSQYGKGSVFQFVIYNHETIGTLDEFPTVETMPDEKPSTHKSTFVTTTFDPKVGLNRLNSTSTNNQGSAVRSLLNLGASRKLQGEFCLCPKVLLVDDTSYNVFALRTLLNSFGLQCDSAYDGKEAIKAIEEEHDRRKNCCGGYKMIFMDCNMPIMDGYEATRNLKAKMEAKELLSVPIIGWTAYTDKAALDECINVGMDDCLTKPVPIKALEELLRRYELVFGK